MTSYLTLHKDQLIAIVNQAISETFRVYFKIDVDIEKMSMFDPVKDGLVCRAIVKDEISYGALLLSIEKNMLNDLAKAVYPADIAGSKEALESCALEVTNIVCSRIKTYFNEHGHNFHMGLPEILDGSQKDNTEIEILFSVREKKLSIDIGLRNISDDFSPKLRSAE